MKKALIGNDNLVIQVSDKDFPVAEPWFWVDCPDDVVAGSTTYNNGVFESAPEPESTAEENKNKAVKLLSASDFSVLPDVNLANRAEWEAYRADLRQVATNPTSGNLTWPTKPETIWG